VLLKDKCKELFWSTGPEVILPQSKENDKAK